MEYYQVLIRHKSQKVGIGYDGKNGIVWVGGYNRVLNHITAITFKYLKVNEDKLTDLSGTRQRNRYRYYAAISDLEFRKGLVKLGLRYAVMPCNAGIFKFT